MGAQGKPWSKVQHTTYTVYVWVCHSLEHLLPGVIAPYRGIAPVCLLVSCIYTLPLMGFQQSIPATWYRQLIWKKTRSTPKHSCKHVLVQNPTAYPKQTTFYHNTLILSWRHFCVTFISLFSYPSAGSPHSGGLTLTEGEILWNVETQQNTGTVLSQRQTPNIVLIFFYCCDNKCRIYQSKPLNTGIFKG